MNGWRLLFAAAAVAYLVGIVIQVLLAGAALFDMTDFKAHVGLGWGLGSAPSSSFRWRSWHALAAARSS